MIEDEPKRWLCMDCGFVSKRTRTKKVRNEFIKATFYCCYKCKGHIKESDEWLKWHESMRERSRPAMLAWMESRKVGK